MNMVLLPRYLLTITIISMHGNSCPFSGTAPTDKFDFKMFQGTRSFFHFDTSSLSSCCV